MATDAETEIALIDARRELADYKARGAAHIRMLAENNDALRAEVESLQAQLAGEGHDRCEKACVCYDDGFKHAKADLAAVRTDLSVARAALEDIAREDYRGPRPSGAVKAAAALAALAEPEPPRAGGPLTPA